MGPHEVAIRILPRLNICEVAAAGDRGLVASAWSNQYVLPEYAGTGTFAETVTAQLVAFFQQAGGTFFDVGANIGLTTIPVARDPAVKCLAFEPGPTNFGLLQRNVARKAPAANVEFHQAALFANRGTMALSVADANLGDHRLTRSSIDGRRSIEIPTYPLDDFLDLVRSAGNKDQYTGCRAFVVAGARKGLDRAALLIMEFCPSLMRKLDGDADRVVEAISSFEKIVAMRGGHSQVPHFIECSNAQSLFRKKLATATASDGDYLDVIAIRSEGQIPAALSPNATT